MDHHQLFVILMVVCYIFFLFILCSSVLSRSLKGAEDYSRVILYQFGLKGPRFSHPLFANYLLLVVKAMVDNNIGFKEYYWTIVLFQGSRSI